MWALARRRDVQIEGVAFSERHHVGGEETLEHVILRHHRSSQLEIRHPRDLVGDLLENAHRRGRGGHGVNAPGADDIGQTVGVGQHRCRAAGHDEPGELTRSEQCVLDMEMDVDEGGRHVPARRIDLRDRLQPAGRRHRGDILPDNEHVALNELSVVEREHRTSTDGEVGRLVAAGCGLEPHDLFGVGNELGADEHLTHAKTRSSTSWPNVPSTTPMSVTCGPVRQARLINMTETQRLGERPGRQPNGFGRGSHLSLPLSDLGGGQRRQDPGHWELEDRDDLAVLRHRDSSPGGNHRVGGHCHVRRVTAEDREVVGCRG